MRNLSLNLLLILILTTALILIPGCSGCRKPGPPANVLVYGLRSDPMFLNPIIASEMTSITVNSFIFNALLRYNEKMELEGDLAESWSASPDGRKITFTLRKGVTWHDGAPFTARDVKFTFDTLFEPSTNTYNRGLFQVDGKNPGVTVKDDLTVEFTLPKPSAPFISNIASLGIVPFHILKGSDINRGEFNWHPVGTGPFIYKEWKASEKVLLTANKAYFRGAPKLDGILLLIIPSAESRRIALMTGTIDVSTLSTEDLRAVKDMKNIEVYKWSQLCYYYLGFDLTKELFQDRKVRQAINYAIDKKRIVKAVLQGTGEVATGPIPIPSWAYTGDVEQYHYNPEKARSLLKEAGWTITGKDGTVEKEGKKLEFELRYPSGSPPCEKASVFIQNNLALAGIKADLRSTEFSALINTLNPGQFEAVIMDWIENPDPDCFVEWHSSQIGDKGMNFMSYSNKDVDRLLLEARETLNTKKRIELYSEFQKVLVDDAPYVFLWNPDAVVAINKRIQGFSKPGPAGIFIDPEKVYIVPPEQ